VTLRQINPLIEHGFFINAGYQRQTTPNGHNGNGHGNVVRDPISPAHNDSSDYKYGERGGLVGQMKIFDFFRFSFSTGRFDASALHIAHALKQTEVQKSYDKGREKPIEEYLVS
jgi:hypothetical protein